MEPRKREVTVAGYPVTVREITVREVRDWLADAEQSAQRQDVISLALWEEITLADLQRMSDLSDSVADQALPSEVDKLIEAARELNPHFFGLLRRLAAAGKTGSDS